MGRASIVACLFVVGVVLFATHRLLTPLRHPIHLNFQDSIEVRASEDKWLDLEDNVLLYKRSIAQRNKVVQDVYGGDVSKIIPWEGLKGGLYLWDYFMPLFNCPVRERFGKISDGGKVLCNLGAVARNRDCVVFSFGVRDDVTFEEELMRKTRCTIYAFDPSVAALPNGATVMRHGNCAAAEGGEEGEGGGSIQFEKIGLGSSNVVAKKSTDYNLQTLETLMRAKGVTTIDLLKVDIEGSEWDVFRQLAAAGTLEHVNQLSIELHFKQKTTNLNGEDSGVGEVFDFFHAVESAGLYAFSNEVNYNPPGFSDQKPYCIEYSFVRANSPFLTSRPTLSQDLTAPCSKKSKSGRQGHRKATGVLTRSYKNVADYHNLITRTNAILATTWAQNFDHIIFHDEGLTDAHEAFIRLNVHNRKELRFLDVSEVFKRYRAKPIKTATQLSSLHHCDPTELSKSFAVGYHIMCSFWFAEIAEVQLTGEYDFLLRVDEDIVVSPTSTFDVPDDTAAAAFISTAGCYGMDDMGVTKGMEPFFSNLASSEPGRRANFSWSGKTWNSPLTSLALYNLQRMRTSQKLKLVVKRVQESQCILSNRWGDLPLWGATLSLLASPFSFLDISYSHGSWNKAVTAKSSC